MKAEDLTGKIYGDLKVLYRTDDHICASGQKKVCWMCECLRCGTQKAITVQDLKKGVKSCGCYRNSTKRRNKKICVICCCEFECPPSSKKVTCSKECNKAYAKIRNTGREMSKETRRKISYSKKGIDTSELQKKGTAAAMKSPKAGRFETNVNAVDWHLVSPEGKHYHFHSLANWLRKNGKEMFGCDPDTREFRNVASGIEGAKRTVLGKTGHRGCCTYKGWQVIPTEKEVVESIKGKKKEKRSLG